MDILKVMKIKKEAEESGNEDLLELIKHAERTRGLRFMLKERIQKITKTLLEWSDPMYVHYKCISLRSELHGYLRAYEDVLKMGDRYDCLKEYESALEVKVKDDQ